MMAMHNQPKFDVINRTYFAGNLHLLLSYCCHDVISVELIAVKSAIQTRHVL